MKKLTRFIKHLTAARWQVRRRLPRHSMNAIEAAIHASEKLHMGELRFAVEAGLDWPDLFAGITSRERALEVFSHLRVWDTEHNSGVLIYLLLSDRKVEIVADRGIHSRVGNSAWISICQDMESKFRTGNFEGGVQLGISEVTALLQQHFPARDQNPNDLPDHPIVI
ncbi:MAG TPA: TPM domain-containing protein [Gallionellaceae bacterium]|nr:TPM domain-containing protein [Gallionellaceae bacterium]